MASLVPPHYVLPWPRDMTEGWVDCPSLGPGWQRREVLRKNASRPGQSDTYYVSPRGEKIRSRVELMRLLGGSRDLTDFDFKKGVFIEPSAEPAPPLPPPAEIRRKVKKGSKRRLPSLPEATPPLKKPPDLPDFELPPDEKPPKLELEIPTETPASIPDQQPQPLAPVEQLTPKPHKRRHQKQPSPILAEGKMGDATMPEIFPEETIACCASCQGQFPGVMLPTQRRCRWLCPDCRAQRRDFNREQRYYKQVGCGVCQACQMSQDCGICTVCVVRAKSPELRIGIKCLLRRCLRIVKKGLECGLCQACKITEDCGTCYICVRRQKPGMKRQWKCLKRRCLRRKKKILPKKEGYSSKKLVMEASPPKDTFTQARRQQKRPASATDGPPPKAQRAPRRRRKRLSAVPVVPTKWKPTMERDPGGVSMVWHMKKQQLGTVKERKMVGRLPKHPTNKLKNSVHSSKSRQNRKCGECEACQLKIDCGRCDFCQDKPKFGGGNLKRQKCRWRQCLHFAMKRLLPEEWSSPEGAAVAAGWKVRRRRNAFGGRSRKPARIKQVGRRGAKGRGQKRRAKASFQPEAEEMPSISKPLDLSKPQHLEVPNQQPPKLKEADKERAQDSAKDLSVAPQQVKGKPQVPQQLREETKVLRPPTPPTQLLVKESDTRLPAINLLLATSPKVKQECAEPGGDHRPLSDSPVLAGLPQSKSARETQGCEVVVLDDEEDDEVEQLQQLRPPVIMEIYSLGGVQPLNQLDSVLREFLAELHEIPLPAHWEVLPLLGGPNLRLVQRSKHSTMSSAVIHIRPGLFFHVVVRDLPVPPEHELYASHPTRLTTVDEVVELIGDLEAYRLCPGWPAGWHAGERSQACDVLVYSGCCPQCRLNPWPSGSGTH
ncbi:methyl-CpG-binding domain protein 1 isoform X4 [Sphaerodactylus townsendi]|uniref:methyl-CpG-binding domain protein 1 isoform X4 n=1 Tax=Sphaerodactylus townsendi TaxID=933632 RepID=UPI00202658EF|nr:methyl-CpG-binding domain protein 1 isoform X4 [Sphaerodactylus townsendi]